jgi:hypothetical protein
VAATRGAARDAAVLHTLAAATVAEADAAVVAVRVAAVAGVAADENLRACIGCLAARQACAAGLIATNGTRVVLNLAGCEKSTALRLHNAICDPCFF